MSNISKSSANILWFKEISNNDVAFVGGKNASLGEMYNHLKPKGINIPNGFAITSRAYFSFLKEAGLSEKMTKLFQKLNVKDINNLQRTGKEVRKMILNASLPKELSQEILDAYHVLSKEYGEKTTDVAVRSSSTAED